MDHAARSTAIEPQNPIIIIIIIIIIITLSVV